jgi:thioredoxin-related protein
MPGSKILAVAAFIAVAAQWCFAETKLLMAEEPGCYWCAQWNEEIAHIYPKTAEGRAAPLERYDLRSETPQAELKQKARFTPTFILIEDGREVGRMEGYPGHDFFWGLLNRMFQDAEISLDEKG